MSRRASVLPSGGRAIHVRELFCRRRKNDPAFRTKPRIALQLAQQAILQAWPFGAVVADFLYDEDRGLREGLRTLQAPYVLALNPSHAWWHPEGVAGSLQEVAREAGWVNAEQPGQRVRITRTFRDGSTPERWPVEIVAGPYGPGKKEMAENRDQLPDWSSQHEKLEKLFDELLIEEHYSSPITFKSYFNA